MPLIVSNHLGQLLTIVLMAFALGMDAFSLGIGMGMRGIRLLNVIKVSVVIGLFHMIMPLMGLFMGQYISTLLGDIATIAGGILLIMLGIHMIYSSLRGNQAQLVDHTTMWGLLLFALMVSIDSFSVGVSLGMFATDLALTVITFGLFGGMMSILGLMTGRRFRNWTGEYGEAIGGAILLVFGFKFLF